MLALLFKASALFFTFCFWSFIIGLSQFESLKTPTSKERPAEFVASRANYSKDVEFSPIPENLGTVADEDLWMQLNKGCVTDLEMLEMTPGFKCATSLADDKASVSNITGPCLSLLILLAFHLQNKIGFMQQTATS